jgi:hypothetical protein
MRRSTSTRECCRCAQGAGLGGDCLRGLLCTTAACKSLLAHLYVELGSNLPSLSASRLFALAPPAHPTCLLLAFLLHLLICSRAWSCTVMTAAASATVCQTPQRSMPSEQQWRACPARRVLRSMACTLMQTLRLGPCRCRRAWLQSWTPCPRVLAAAAA